MATNSEEESVLLLRIRDLRNFLLEKRVFDRVDAVLNDLLPSGPAILPRSGKIVKDLIWGIITIPAFLVPVVDSRLLQRQRRIRQLGLSYLVYPSAGYGRFEHALGCCHVISELLRSIEARSDVTPPEARVGPISPKRRKQLMLGALLHDIGHMPFSHASEECIEEFSDKLKIGEVTVEALRQDVFNEAFEKELHVAEILSVLVLLSPRFQTFMAPLVSTEASSLEDFFSETAAFVAGARLSSMDLAYSMVLSGPLDADRLDYMIRDAQVSGVPVSVDIPRLLARCAFVKIPTNALPEGMRNVHDSLSTVLFATDLSGANALEELAVSRFMLYDRIYNHQKTQAAQAVLTELIHQSFDLNLFESDLLSFWSLTDESFLHVAEGKIETRPLARRLLYRELPKRAVAFSNRSIDRPVSPFKSENTGQPEQEAASERTDRAGEWTDTIDALTGHLLDRIDDAFTVSATRKGLQIEIADRARKMCALLPAQYRPRNNLEMVLVRRRPQNPFNTVGEAVVLDQDLQVTKFKTMMPIGPWSAVFDINKKFGYVYCDDGWQEIVAIAAEIVLWEKFAISSKGLEVRFRVTPKAPVRAKLSPKKISHLKRLLDAKGVFTSARLLRPLEVEEHLLDNLEKRFAFFQGAGEWVVTKSSLERFVRQFPVELQRPLCDLLAEVTTIDRSASRRGLEQQLMACRAVLPGSAVRIFGLSPSSGSVLRAIAEGDLKSTLGDRFLFEHHDIMSLSVSDETVVLLDDLVTSGTQASTLLQALMGVAQESRLDPSEVNIFDGSLTEEQIESLRRRPVRVVYVYGSDKGTARLEEVAKGLGVSNFQVLVGQRFQPRDISSKYGQPLSDHLRSIGREVLATSKIYSRKANVEEDALGYGGITACFVSTFNVPTCCPPALWCPGTVQGSPWIPLFIRRGYQEDVTLM